MLIDRKIIPEIEKHLFRPEITLITGARQVGKTTIMRVLYDKLVKEGQNVLFFNLDFEGDYKYFSSQQTFLRKVNLEVGQNKVFVFVDEIQRKENAGLFLKGIYDQVKNIKLIVSGSGSLELKEKIHESLTGRKRVFEILPVSFVEYVNHQTSYNYQDRLHEYLDIETQSSVSFLNEYLRFGGYPAVITADTQKEKKFIMDEVFSSYIKKDLSFLLNLHQPEYFIKLLGWLSHTSTTNLKFSTCANDIGISLPTLKKYLWYAEHTFILKQVTPYHTNKRKEIIKSPVVYFFDTGFKNYAFGNFGAELDFLNPGQVFENFIFSVLYNRIKNTPYQIHYWRSTDKAEVDFVISLGKEVVPLEVKFKSLKNNNVSRSFRSFMSLYHPPEAYVVNLVYRGETKIEDTNVFFIPFYELFVENDQKFLF